MYNLYPVITTSSAGTTEVHSRYIDVVVLRDSTLKGFNGCGGSDPVATLVSSEKSEGPY
jgi:hypothetical protein